MKIKYSKPIAKVIQMQGQSSLLETSHPQGMTVKISGYTSDTSTDDDGWD